MSTRNQCHRDHYGYPLADMPAAHRKALEAIDWPVLDLDNDVPTTTTRRTTS